MKKSILVIVVLTLLFTNSLLAQVNQQATANSPTSMGMVIYSNDVETVWNTFRLANYSKNQGETVQVFLLAKGVEVDLLVNDNKDLKEQVDAILEKVGEIQGCGTCLKSRKMMNHRFVPSHHWRFICCDSEKQNSTNILKIG
jgi:uncharacterized protein involved in oxidation of intracellular sulfur